MRGFWERRRHGVVTASNRHLGVVREVRSAYGQIMAADQTSKTPSNAEIYADLRHEFATLVSGLEPAEQGLTVPQCPAWSIKDVLAHVVGITADIVNDNLAGIGSDGWTEAQVAGRAGMTVAEICAEWDRLGPQIDQLCETTPVMAMRATADLVTHLHDVLMPLGRTGDKTSAAVELGLERYGPYFCERVADAGLPVVRVEAGNKVWQSADGEAAATWRGTSFDVLRAVSGRRSAAQILAMDWSGDAAPYLAVVTPYGLPAEPVVE